MAKVTKATELWCVIPNKPGAVAAITAAVSETKTNILATMSWLSSTDPAKSYYKVVSSKTSKSVQAIADYTQYLAKDPKSALAYHNRGVAYRVKGETAKAQTDFKEALKLSPEFQPSANELKALEAQALWQEFEARLKDAKKKTDKDRIKELKKELKILKEQVKSLTELVLQRPANYLYPVMPAYMPLAEENPDEKRLEP